MNINRTQAIEGAKSGVKLFVALATFLMVWGVVGVYLSDMAFVEYRPFAVFGLMVASCGVGYWIRGHQL